MHPKSVLSRVLACGILSLLGVTAACSAEDQAAVAAHIQSQQQRAVLASAQVGGLSDAQLARLAKCESGGNPRARSANGKYHGLYQFDQGTWNGTARSVLPEFVGVSPSSAPAAVQDAMARALYNARGRSPWPVCGRRM